MWPGSAASPSPSSHWPSSAGSRRAGAWLGAHHPEIASFAEVTRDHCLAWITHLAEEPTAPSPSTTRRWPRCSRSSPCAPTPRSGPLSTRSRAAGPLPVHAPRQAAVDLLPVRDPDQQACKAVGLFGPGGRGGSGRGTVTAHRFRHTVGTQLAERGATLHTIMKVLGHSSVSMALVHAQLSNHEVLRDYQAVLAPGATIAGPAAAELKSGRSRTRLCSG